MDRDAILRKIQALLNVADDKSGATDAECQTALTQARKMMSKYNIEISDLDMNNGKSVSHEEETGIYFNTRYSLWKLPLAEVMAKHCACAVMMRKQWRAKSSRILFVGEKENPKMVKMMFAHAVNHIEQKIYKLHDQYSAYTPDIRYSFSDSYAKGFIDGLEAQYKDQDTKDHETALMVVRPISIDEFFKDRGVTSHDYSTTENRFHSAEQYGAGYRDGHQYGEKKLDHQMARLE